MRREAENITSRQNPLVQLTVSLADKRHREREGLFRFDGRKLFSEAMTAGLPLYAVLVRASGTEAMLPLVRVPEDCRVAVLPDALFDRISEEHAPDGIICLSRRLDKIHKIVTIEKRNQLGDLLLPGHTLVLESVRDPGNLGTVIRSAAAFGVANLVLSSDCADLYNPRTLRAAMGTLFHTPVTVVEDLPAALSLLSTRGRVYAAALQDSAVRLGEFDFGPNDSVLVGNEGHGLSPLALAAATDTLYIPMEKGVESLNAGIAASLLLWQMYQGGKR